MINFRYHIVSLTAVFLALLIGILMGTTVVSKATVDGLEANLERAEARSAAVHETNDELTDELATLTETDAQVDAALTKDVLPSAIEGSLESVPVLIIASESADQDALTQLVTALGDAGAALDGTLVVDDRLVLEDSDIENLRELLELPQGVDVQAAVNRQLAIALAHAALPGATLRGVGTTTTTTVPGDPNPEPDDFVPPAQPEIVTTLRQNGYLGFRPAAAGSSDAPVLEAPELAPDNGYRYLVVSGTEADPVNSTVLVPLIAAMGRLGSVAQVAATGPRPPTETGISPFLATLVERDDTQGRVSTVDNLASFVGNVAAVFALADAGEGQFGSYGIGPSATAVVPQYDRE